MRLKKVVGNLSELRKEIINYQLNPEKIGDGKVIDGYNMACSVYGRINEIEIGDYLKDDILSLSYYANPKMNKKWDPDEFIGFNKVLSDLVRKTETLRVNLKKTMHNSDIKNIYAIKLPNYENLCDVADFSKELSRVFKVVIGDEKKVKLVGFDLGSEWYLIGLELFEEFKVFAEFMTFVYTLVKRTKEDENTLKHIGQDEDIEIKEHMRSIKNVLLKNSARRLGELKDKPLTPEEITELEKALLTMEKLVLQGTEVHVDKQSPPQDNNGNYIEEEVRLLDSKELKKITGTPNTLFLQEKDDLK